MEKNIILIGFMGTGKSAVGQRLARRLKMKFVDTDREIENLTGMTITEIFKKSGEKRFRAEEKLLASRLAGQRGLVVSCGGGMVLDAENMSRLGENGVVIRLEASPEDVYRRVMRKRHQRPLLRRGLTLGELQQMMREREQYYQCADITVNTVSRTVDDVVDMVMETLQKGTT